MSISKATSSLVEDDEIPKKTSVSDEDGTKEKSDKDEKKRIADKRGSLKFEPDEEWKEASDNEKDGTVEKGGKGKKHDKTPKQRQDNAKDEESDKQPFDPKKYKKPTVVVYHESNDLMLGKGVGYKPDDAIPKKGPGVTSDIEKLYGPCTLLTDFKYTTWASTVVPLKNHNIVQGFNEMTLCLIKMAANGRENMSHDDAFLAVSFLSNVRNDLGEYPPNVLALMEHIDYLTRNDGTPGAGKPKFRQMDSCNLKDWY